MAYSCVSLIAEVKAVVGRTDDTVHITDARTMNWLNDAQDAIVEACPELDFLRFSNRTSLDTTVVLKYAISDITVGDETIYTKICYLNEIYYLDGVESVKLNFVMTDEFDKEWPDPTHADVPRGKPEWWTKRAGNIEIYPVCLTAYADNDLRFEGTRYAKEFTAADTTRVSDLSKADEGLLRWAVSRAWGYIGTADKEVLWDAKFNNWLADYKAQSERMHEWDGNLFSDNIT